MKTRTWLALPAIIFSLLVATTGASATKDAEMAGQAKSQETLAGKSRAAILAETKAALADFERRPSDDAVRLLYANLLYQSGRFRDAWQVAQPFASAADASVEELTLAARLAFLLGQYDEAERLYGKLVEATAGNVADNVKAKVGLMFTYYEQDKFDAIKAIEFPAGVQLPQHQAIKAFQGQPYELSWDSADKVATIPFIVMDPLPVITVEVNGVPMAVLFDTGADNLILDTEVAKALGVKATATAKGGFGGGKEAEFGFGQVDSVKLGEVTMAQVPVMILPTKRFSNLYKEDGLVLGGIIGTAMMRQFLGTIDYKNKRFVLRERNPASAAALREAIPPGQAVEIPFAMQYTHMMMVNGSINGVDGLTFFVDSGLAMEQASFTAPVQTLNYLGIPEPPRAIDPNSAGGGGGAWPSGLFAVDSIGIGPLVQKKVKGEYGARPPESYWSYGFIEDGLISHGFLKKYSSWTLDFDRMVYTFER